ncbi:MAG: arsenate reductase family protein [Desulfitobacteriaceae bacterium]
MNIQIFGVNKCFDSKKAERYFKERNIKYQLIDLTQKGLSKGELQSVKAVVGLNNLINSSAKDYKRLNMDRIISSNVKEEILLNNPSLYKTPIVRNGKQATVGYEPDIWKTWEYADLL